MVVAHLGYCEVISCNKTAMGLYKDTRLCEYCLARVKKRVEEDQNQ